MCNDDKLTEEGKNSLIVFLGVMLRVSGFGTAVKGVSSALAGQAVKPAHNKHSQKLFIIQLSKNFS